MELEEDFRNNNSKKNRLILYFTMANKLAISDSNIPFLQQFLLELNLSSDEIKDNMMMLKEIQRTTEYVFEHAEEFILKSLND